MHDGQNLFEPKNSYIGIDWGIDNAVKSLIVRENIPPPIIVGIWNTENRMGEYMPEQALQSRILRKEMENFLKEYRPESKYNLVGDHYVAFIVEELKPWVDETYLTLADQENTYIMGSSMGGFISLYALCQYPHIFCGAGCLSNAWNIGDGILLPYFQTVLPNLKTNKIYLDMGGNETDMPVINEFLLSIHSQITRTALDHGYQDGRNFLSLVFPNHKHSEKYWRKRVHIPLRFFLR
jgi:predicted alpha/beta superfamily hydrolase